MNAPAVPPLRFFGVKSLLIGYKFHTHPGTTLAAAVAHLTEKIRGR